jgi:lipopolysaccharide/colanic/teichoic acid biosynthesis glycosyltransferase
MVPGAEKTGGDTTARDDPRVTPVGKILRKYKIDEIPQLVNVLRGEMSFVGPRPELVDYVNRYSEEERIILSVRPGITDISSLKFSSLDEHVGADDADRVFEERILPEKNALRVQYIRERCLSLDMSLLFRTAVAVLRKMILGTQH